MLNQHLLRVNSILHLVVLWSQRLHNFGLSDRQYDPAVALKILDKSKDVLQQVHKEIQQTKSTLE
jgi:hypothetical protein